MRRILTYIIVPEELVVLIPGPRFIGSAGDHGITQGMQLLFAMGKQFCYMERPVSKDLERLKEANCAGSRVS